MRVKCIDTTPSQQPCIQPKPSFRFRVCFIQVLTTRAAAAATGIQLLFDVDTNSHTPAHITSTHIIYLCGRPSNLTNQPAEHIVIAFESKHERQTRIRIMRSADTQIRKHVMVLLSYPGWRG